MQIEVGDRVRFKAQLPDRTEPELQHNIGWEGEPGQPDSRPITVRWSSAFGSEQGVVTSTDLVNGEVCVRGRNGDGNDFTVWIEERYLDIVEQGVPR